VNTILLLVAIGFTGEYTMVMLVLGWPTRLILLGSLIGFAFYAARNHGKHHRSEAYDSRLTNIQMERAREWLIGMRREKESRVEE